MKFSVIILLLSYIAIVTCKAVSSNSDCKWTGCEGLLKNGGSLCREYGTGIYTGRTNKDKCSWDTERVECCKKTGCIWTNTCAEYFDGNFACNRDFGQGYKPSEKMERCVIGFFQFRHECCPK